MSYESIIKDTMSTFAQNNNKFWKDESELAGVLDEYMQELPQTTGADVFSITHYILNGVAKLIKKQGEVDSCLWKTVVKAEKGKIFKSLENDYEETIADLRKQYPAPLPEVLTKAQDLLEQITEFISIKELADQEQAEDTLTYIKDTSFDLTDQILGLFKELSVTDTLYASGSDTIETYNKIVKDALNTYKVLITPKVVKEDN